MIDALCCSLRAPYARAPNWRVVQALATKLTKNQLQHYTKEPTSHWATDWLGWLDYCGGAAVATADCHYTYYRESNECKRYGFCYCCYLLVFPAVLFVFINLHVCAQANFSARCCGLFVAHVFASLCVRAHWAPLFQSVIYLLLTCSTGYAFWWALWANCWTQIGWWEERVFFNALVRKWKIVVAVMYVVGTLVVLTLCPRA